MSDSFDFLGLPGVRTTAKVETDDAITVEAETTAPRFRQCCLLCNRVSDGQRAKRRLINDTNHGGKATVIHMRVRRAKCRSCGKRGMDEIIPHLAEGRHMTQRLYDFIASEGPRNTHAKIGRSVHVSEGTARSIVRATMAEHLAYRDAQTPRVLGIDEKTILRKYRAVVADIAGRQVLDILHDRDWALDAYLDRLPEKNRVQVVCIDMYWGFRKTVSRYLPHTEIVTDKFHVLRRANMAFDAIRRKLVADLDGRQRSELRQSKRLFGMREKNLKPDARERVRRWHQLFPVLSEAYWTKERYFEMYEFCHTPEEAEHYYRHWMKTLPASIRSDFQKACSIKPEWRRPVFAYFDHPYTTGYVESINRTIDEIQRIGRGYSFEMMRGKMLLAGRVEPRTFRNTQRLRQAAFEVCRWMTSCLTLSRPATA
ncbi:ISL3 family transposase [Antarcticirhabdus aurantiaca]|uniref:ISL3 family transposase n=1 Tax=Antarcticirhabdus aurantiaca TaxID=2606717 RepID=A0ACD4NL76_9HYPH|nr:ISL3 family transposase [Jeongeuplla avenae]